MSRLTPWWGREPQARRRFSFRRAMRGALVLAGFVAAALWGIGHMDKARETVFGRATVTDGDSIRVGGVEIRLEGVDAPEMAQLCRRNGEPYRCGEEARRELRRLVEGAEILCRIKGHDRYRRSLAQCEANGEDVAASLIRRGFAVAYGRTYAFEELRARAGAAGLWAGTFERPSDWRKAHRPAT